MGRRLMLHRLHLYFQTSARFMGFFLVFFFFFFIAWERQSD